MDVRIGIVSGGEIAINRDGTVPGRILQAVFSDMGDVQNVQTCQNGEEHFPPNGAAVIAVEAGSAYKLAVAVDDGIAPIMEQGGKRVYSVDPTGAEVMAEARLHPDGKIELINSKASFTALPDGTITAANGDASFSMSPDGHFTFHGIGSTFDHPVTMEQTLNVSGALSSELSITAPEIVGTTDVTFDGKSAATHIHTGGIISGKTGAPV